jgi:hypothetical protein
VKGTDPGEPASVSFIQAGYRDVFWCSILNEPAIIEYRQGKAFCDCCDDSPFNDSHVFICHIHKPTGAKL